MSLQLRSLVPAELELLHRLILELGASDGVAQVLTTPQALHDALFGKEPAAFARLILHDERVAGFVLFSWRWGTFTGTQDLYLNAIYVSPEFRRLGLARAAMAQLARIAVERGSTRMEWLTVRDKAQSQDFYESIGSQPAEHMQVRRLQGDALNLLAAQVHAT